MRERERERMLERLTTKQKKMDKLAKLLKEDLSLEKNKTSEE
jgi:hypothetical protein